MTSEMVDIDSFITYPNFLLAGSMYGTNEKTGLEGLQPTGKRQGS